MKHYIPIETNMMDNDAVCVLINKYGMRGYGTYMAIIIELRKHNNYSCGVDTLRMLARKCKVKFAFLLSVITDFGLFDVEETEDGKMQISGQSENPVATAQLSHSIITFAPMKQYQILRTVFPKVITDNFNFVDYQESDSTLEYWLDEREYMSREDYKKGTVRPYGFTESKTIQDFPIRGRSVYLHVRRRKWIDRSTGEIFTYDFDDLTEDGSKLSPEFVAFLKEED